MWVQCYDPLGNWPASTLAAALPVFVLLGLLVWGRLNAGGAALAGLSAACITLAPKKLIRTRRASEGSASEPSLARRVSMCKGAKLSCRGNIMAFSGLRMTAGVIVIRLWKLGRIWRFGHGAEVTPVAVDVPLPAPQSSGSQVQLTLAPGRVARACMRNFRPATSKRPRSTWSRCRRRAPRFSWRRS